MRRTAFTLIELLIVISIITLLIALLLPALRAARELAMSIQCQSRMRGIHVASMAYSTDFRAVPSGMTYENHISAPQSTPRDSGWYASQGRPWTTGPGAVVSTMRGGYLPQDKQVSWCPAKDRQEFYSRVFYWGMPILSQPWGLLGSPYGVNSLAFNSFDDTQYVAGGAIPMHRWDERIKAFYLMDVNGGATINARFRLEAFGRHLEGVNVTYAGGHTENMSYDTVTALFDADDRTFLWGE